MSWDWDATSLAALATFLEARGLADGAPEPRRIGEGHSNLTYLIRVAGGRAVLRRPPPPPVPKGANDVLREARVLAALEGQGTPTPRILAVAQAGEALDVPFYVMEHVPGHVVTDALPAAFEAKRDGRAIAFGLVDALADLHAVDWRACGLSDFGQPKDFNARHIRRLEGLMQAHGAPSAALADMAARLRAGAPPESGAAIVHNDFRLGNVIWSIEAPPRLMAILDWELATIGDPLFDLGYVACCCPMPGETAQPDAGALRRDARRGLSDARRSHRSLRRAHGPRRLAPALVCGDGGVETGGALRLPAPPRPRRLLRRRDAGAALPRQRRTFPERELSPLHSPRALRESLACMNSRPKMLASSL
jgi:aminoglycoside phosphotransferase (APT) family kinase protein